MTSSLVSIGSGDRHVLAVHGWFGSARGWGSLPEFLDRSTYTYAFMDLRGYGGRKQVRRRVHHGGGRGRRARPGR